ncbi:hypothetical protein HPB52_022283 [Rhipicephalus sanguineus]|uniref:Endonuclease/exonuclease/phosphatase domain-containing protein n=1 Tax=Rhipicephalus sanguineus TaxID=34632 RepID=A0A9D4TBX1_RHISA|nr:hypothetical protein HPB52_022283 [Rhipicephalus sanguineus]
MVEIIPTRKTEQSLYLANLYSPPREQLHQYDHFQHGLTLWNDLLQPTRVGNSVSRDTNPDLTFTRDQDCVQKATWTRLPDTLGSDHHIIEIEVEQAHRSPKMGKAWLTDWNAYRQDLDDYSTIEDIEAWLNEKL